MGLSATLDAVMAANFQGQQLLDEADARRAETAFRKQQTEHSRLTNEALAQTEKDRQAMMQFMQADQAKADQPAQTAQDKANFYSRAGEFAARRGDFDASKRMGELAKGELDLASKEQKIQSEAKATNLEELASAALDAESSPSPEAHAKVFRAAVKAGIPPQDVPMPGTPQYSTFVKQAQTSSMNAQDRVQMAERVREFEAKQTAQKEEAEARREDRRLQREQTASNQAFQHQMARENLDIRKTLADSLVQARDAKANAPTKISATMERQATAVVNAANEAGAALTRMSKMPSGLTVSAFNHLEDPKTVLKALTTTGTNKLNPERVQMMQANLQMLGLEVAQAMAAPYKPNKEQISEARRAVEPIPGDTEYTAIYKIALAADVLKTRLEATPRTDALAHARSNAENTLNAFPTAAEIYEQAKKQNVKLGKVKDSPTFMQRMTGMTGAGAEGPPPDIQKLLDKYPARKP